MMVHNGSRTSWSMLVHGPGRWFVVPVHRCGSRWSMVLVHPGGGPGGPGVDCGTRELRLYLRQMAFSSSHSSVDFLFPSPPQHHALHGFQEKV